MHYAERNHNVFVPTKKYVIICFEEQCRVIFVQSNEYAFVLGRSDVNHKHGLL